MTPWLHAPALCCPNVILDWLLTMAGVARDVGSVVCTGLPLGISDVGHSGPRHYRPGLGRYIVTGDN